MIAPAFDPGPAQIRAIPPDERRRWAMSIQQEYARRSPFGLHGMDPDAWVADVDEIVLVGAMGAWPGAVIFSCVNPDLACDVHLLRWGKMPRELWQQGCRDACQWLFGRYPRLARVDAWVPVEQPAPLDVARAVGFEEVGVIPGYFRALDDKLHDVLLLVLHRSAIGGP